MNNSELKILTVKEVAETLRVSASSVYELVHQNKIKHAKIGSRFLIPFKAVEDFINISIMEENNDRLNH